MSIKFYPLDHLPTGDVTLGRNMPHTSSGGGLRLTDYSMFYNSTYKTTLEYIDGKKYILGGDERYSRGKIELYDDELYDESSLLIIGFNIKINSLPSSESSTRHGGIIQLWPIDYSDSTNSRAAENNVLTLYEIGDFSIGDEFYIEVSLAIGSEATGVCKRWVDGRRLEDLVLSNSDILNGLINKTYSLSISSRTLVGMRDIYLAGNGGVHPVHVRLGPIQETRIELESVIDENWVVNDGSDINEFLNSSVTNTYPFEQYVRSITNSPLKYKVVPESFPDQPIVGVVAGLAASKDSGSAIRMTSVYASESINDGSSQRLLNTNPHIFRTNIETENLTHTPLNASELADLTIEHTFETIDEE